MFYLFLASDIFRVASSVAPPRLPPNGNEHQHQVNQHLRPVLPTKNPQMFTGFLTLQGTHISHLWKRKVIFPTCWVLRMVTLQTYNPTCPNIFRFNLTPLKLNMVHLKTPFNNVKRNIIFQANLHILEIQHVNFSGCKKTHECHTK